MRGSPAIILPVRQDARSYFSRQGLPIAAATVLLWDANEGRSNFRPFSTFEPTGCCGTQAKNYDKRNRMATRKVLTPFLVSLAQNPVTPAAVFSGWLGGFRLLRAAILACIMAG
jgi:hypothetical protein